MQLAHCHGAFWWWKLNLVGYHPSPEVLPGPPFPSIWLLPGMGISHCVLVKVSFLPNTLLGPGGQGLLPLLPCVRLHKTCGATLRPVSPQGKSKIETGPF